MIILKIKIRENELTTGEDGPSGLEDGIFFSIDNYPQDIKTKDVKKAKNALVNDNRIVNLNSVFDGCVYSHIGEILSIENIKEKTKV